MSRDRSVPLLAPSISFSARTLASADASATPRSSKHPSSTALTSSTLETTASSTASSLGRNDSFRSIQRNDSFRSIQRNDSFRSIQRNDSKLSKRYPLRATSNLKLEIVHVNSLGDLKTCLHDIGSACNSPYAKLRISPTTMDRLDNIDKELFKVPSPKTPVMRNIEKIKASGPLRPTSKLEIPRVDSLSDLKTCLRDTISACNSPRPKPRFSSTTIDRLGIIDKQQSNAPSPKTPLMRKDEKIKTSTPRRPTSKLEFVHVDNLNDLKTCLQNIDSACNSPRPKPRFSSTTMDRLDNIDKQQFKVPSPKTPVMRNIAKSKVSTPRTTKSQLNLA